MKRIVQAAIAASVLVSAPLAGRAADLPLRPEPPPPQAPAVYVAPVYNWSGIYIGVNGGWGWGTAKWTVPPTTVFPAGQSSQLNDNGGVIGGTVGANFQTGAFVFGVEGDWDYSGINTGTSSTICSALGSCQTGNNWLSTLRGRIGVAADRLLFYGTGGGAFANMQTTLNGVTSTKTQTGWTAGVGAEWAFAENWTAKLEYLYIGLGNITGVCTTSVCTGNNGGNPVPGTVSLTANLVRVGVNYKFNF